MAKRKPATPKDTVDIENSIIKEFGEVFQEASELQENPPAIIPTTPRMDMMLGGGVPEGSFVIISGKPKLGKSAISLHLAGNAQKIDSPFGPRKVYYFDIEGRIKERDLFKNHNLDISPDRFQLIRSNIDKLLYSEDFLDIGEKLIRHKPGCVFIFDSFSSMCSKARQEGSVGSRFRDDAPMMLSTFTKRINQIIPINKSIVIGITHIIANQGGMGRQQWLEASGEKIKYQADIKIKGTYFQDWMDGETIIGQDVHWECDAAALRGPGAKATCKLRFQHGYDEEAELVDLASDFGIIEKKGAWFNYIPEDGEPQKFHGEAKCVAFLKENKDICEKIRRRISEEYVTF